MDRSRLSVETAVRALDIADLQSALLSSVLCQPDRCLHLNVDAVALLYDTELTAMLDRVVLARTNRSSPRSSDSWFDAECRTEPYVLHTATVRDLTYVRWPVAVLGFTFGRQCGGHNCSYGGHGPILPQ